MSPEVLVDPAFPHPVQAGGVADQDPAALGQDRVVGGIPRDPEALAMIICLICGLRTFTICADGCLVTLFVSVASLDSCVTCSCSRRAPGHEIVAIMSLAVS